MMKWLWVFLIFLTSCSNMFIGMVKTVPLESDWQLQQTGKKKMYPASVPGDVYYDLFANAVIKDPLFGNNEKELQWVAESDWEYSTNLKLTDSLLQYEYLDLVFDGLDTYSDVFINGRKVLSANNMFRQWRVSIKKYLNNGNNNLTVKLYAPALFAIRAVPKPEYVLPSGESVKPATSPYIRKAAYQFGWDWSPRFLTMGIWKPVRLIAHDGVFISNVQAKTIEIADTVAWISALITTESEKDIRGAIFTVQDAFKETRIRKGTTVTEVRFRVFNPQLWWPMGYGEQKLYGILTKLYVNNLFVDVHNTHTGIRTIELFRDKDEFGENFYFRVNGLPIFIKGANYVPLSNFPSQATHQQYNKIINACADVGINMLRVWGGGIYERDLFYDLCDQHGILVWQDFMFAGSMYPGDPSFIANVKEEATQQITRLRNHPCIALWCGNNEIDVAWKNWGWQSQFKIDPKDSSMIYDNYKKLFHNELPKLVNQHSTSVPYLTSSPMSNWGKRENFKKGNMHYWGVWHGEEPIDSFRVNVPRFMTEYGMQSYPAYTSLLKNSESNRITLNSEFIKNRQRSYKGNTLLMKYVEDYFGKVGNTEDLCYLSQLNQAESMRTAIESHRKNANICMGSMYWQLNDVWDGASWSTLEHNGKWKAAHYYLRRLYAKNLLIAEQTNDSLIIYFQTENTKGQTGDMVLQILDTKGRSIGNFNRKISAGYLKAVAVFEISLKKLLGSQLPHDFIVKGSVIENDSTIAQVLYCLEKPKEMNLQKPQLKTVINSSGNEGTIIISTDVFAKGVYLEFDNSEATFSDNYFDMAAGEEKEIQFSKTTRGVDELSLKVTSYYKK